DGRIGPGIAEPAAAERKRKVHETLVKPLVVGRKGHCVGSIRRAGRGAESARPKRAERPALRHPEGKIPPPPRVPPLERTRGGPGAAPQPYAWLLTQNG